MSPSLPPFWCSCCLREPAGGFRAFVFPDRANPDLVVAVDDFRINETVWDYGGVQHVWVRGPAGNFQLPFSRIRQIEFVRHIGRDYSRADWTWYKVKVTGTNPGETYTGRMEIRVLRGVATGIPWYLFPSTDVDRGRALYRIVIGDVLVPPTIPWEPPAAAAPPPPNRGRRASARAPAAAARAAGPDRRGAVRLDEPRRVEPAAAARRCLLRLRQVGDPARRRGRAAPERGMAPEVAVGQGAGRRVRGPRGTNEYNFGLGMRRADTIRAFLVSQGIALDRIEVVAVGETQLVCTEQTEACWARNRRGSFLITAK